MTIPLDQEVDLLFKKLAGVAKTDTANNKSVSNESIPSPALNRGDTQWTQSGNIPAVASAVGNLVTSYQGNAAIQCTPDVTCVPIGNIYPTWLTTLPNWIPPEFGGSYTVQAYVGPPGYAANITTTGNLITAAGSANVGAYYFDYQAGLLNFIGETIPPSLTSGNVVYITGYRYAGLTGVTNLPSGTNIGNIAISNSTIATNTLNGNINLLANGTGNININTSVSAVGNVSGNYFIGNGSQLSGIFVGTTTNIANGTSNVNIATANGNVTVGVSGVGNVGVFSPMGLSVYGNIMGPVPASSKVFYVAKNGNDSADGGMNTPFLTIKQAMTAAAAAGGGVSVHVAPGVYTEANPITIPPNTALMGDNLRNVTVIPQTPAGDLFYVTSGCYVWGVTIKGYRANGFSYNPATPTQNVFVSPYIQNLTSSAGNATAPAGTAVYIDGNAVSSISTKAMIVGFFTIINQGGKGIHILNSGYSQLVNIYTIACDVGIKVESGGFCTLNGSDCSIGNYGLVADGVGPLQTSAVTTGYSTGGLFNLINETNGQPHVNTVMLIAGDPEYYTIDTIVPTGPTTSTVLVQQTYTGNLAPGATVSFYTRSSIIASAHTFEYVGAGTNPATALPQYGGIPIEANEVIATGGGVVTFTSTDQKGNFKVGLGFVINQATGTITGDDFYKSLYAQMTPYILALSPGP
jgi:hypothetical protein